MKTARQRNRIFGICAGRAAKSQLEDFSLSITKTNASGYLACVPAVQNEAPGLPISRCQNRLGPAVKLQQPAVGVICIGGVGNE